LKTVYSVMKKKFEPNTFVSVDESTVHLLHVLKI
jgi:hypothetical protein